jgi:small subunit ribosomal protein S2e
MEEKPAGRGRGFGRGKPDKAPGARPARGRDAGPPKEKEWVPLTKLGRLVKNKKIAKLEEIFLHSIPIKEPEIVDYFLGEKIKEEMIRIKPVQKQTQAGQRTRFQAVVAIGDGDGHIGVGLKVAKEAPLAIRGAASIARLNIVPVRRGYWGNKIGLPHTVAMKVTGKCGSVRVRLVPAPRGTGIVAPPIPKKILHLAGVSDVYTSTAGKTKSTQNFVKAVYDCLSKTYCYLTPEFWKPNHFLKTPFEAHQDFLKKDSDRLVEDNIS